MNLFGMFLNKQKESKVQDSTNRLEKIMNENKGNFIINKYGFISTNLNSPVVQQRIKAQIMKLKSIEV